MIFINFVASIIVGFLTSLLVALIYGLFLPGGSIQALFSFLTFFAISIICTAGILLLFWIPFLAGVGKGILKVFSLILKEKMPVWLFVKAKKTDGKTLQPEISPNQAALIDYIAQSRQTKTISEAEIRSNLRNAGWSDKDLDQAFNVPGR